MITSPANGTQPFTPITEPAGASYTHSSANGGSKKANAATKIKNRLASLDKRQKGVAIGAVAALILGVVIAAILIIGDGPSDAQIKEVFQSQKFEVEKDSWKTNDAPYNVESVEILAKKKLEDTTGLIKLFSNDPHYYEVKAKVKASNGAVEATRTYDVNFYRDNDTSKWTTISSPTQESEEYVPLRGIDTSAVEENIKKDLDAGYTGYSSVLGKASSGSSNLAKIYAGSTATIGDEKFDKDARTDTVTINLKKDSGVASAEGTVTANFTFSNGKWELASASTNDGATSVNRQGIVGTWTGKFKEQTGVLMGGKCFGAQDQDVTLSITSFDDSTLKAEGTISFLAHYHKTLGGSNQNNTDGDTYLDNQAFSTTFENNYNGSFYGNGGDLRASFQFSENPEGKVRLILSFDEEKGEGSLRITTERGSIMSPARFEDSYTLTKSA